MLKLLVNFYISVNSVSTFECASKVFFYCQIFHSAGNSDNEDTSAPLTKKDFNFLSKHIGDRWKRFARQLNIPDQKVINITCNNKGESNRCYKVFRELEENHGLVKGKMVKMALQELELNEIISKYASLK